MGLLSFVCGKSVRIKGGSAGDDSLCSGSVFIQGFFPFLFPFFLAVVAGRQSLLARLWADEGFDLRNTKTLLSCPRFCREAVAPSGQLSFPRAAVKSFFAALQFTLLRIERRNVLHSQDFLNLRMGVFHPHGQSSNTASAHSPLLLEFTLHVHLSFCIFLLFLSQLILDNCSVPPTGSGSLFNFT